MNHGTLLPLDRCPHCSIARPSLNRFWDIKESTAFGGSHKRFWGAYKCQSCGGVVLAFSPEASNAPIIHMWPPPQTVDEAVPERARIFLLQAMDCLHAPSGAVVLSASAIDSMLKTKGYTEGSLFKRIEAAAVDHLITPEMAAWAHEIRLDANDQRHADEEAPLPNETDAAKVIEFAKALAQFLFVLPARVERGRAT